MSRRTRLFTYGRLKVGYDPPKTSASTSVDHVRGEMWDRRGDDPAMVNIGSPHSPWVEGEVHDIDESELPRIDREERPNYRRTMAIARSGTKVWIYVWVGPMPSVRKLITKWVRR